jgi:hypothetical protein
MIVSLLKNSKFSKLFPFFLVGFHGGYSEFDQLMNNGPNFFNNQFPLPPAFNRYQQYGLNYGYSSPFNNYFNPYF